MGIGVLPAGNQLERRGVPLYLQLIQILRTQIRSGEYKPGDPLPTEEALGKAFGVSRITVREALRGLTADGLIIRQSGRGTFVSERSSPGASIASCTIDDLLYGGQESERTNLSRRVLPASGGLAQSLKIQRGERVVEFQRLSFLRGTPLAHVTLTVPYDLGRRVSERALGARPLILLLCELYDLQLSSVDQWTTASLADKGIGEHLGIAPGDPILVIERHFYEDRGRPIEVAINRYRTQGFRHHLHLERPMSLSRSRESSVRAIEASMTR